MTGRQTDLGRASGAYRTLESGMKCPLQTFPQEAFW